MLGHDSDKEHSGQTLSIKATGILKEDVEEGAYADIVVKYGLITLLKTQIDLCEEIQKVDLKCPLKAGKMTLTKDVELPKQIPPVCLHDPFSSNTALYVMQGKYTVTADVLTKDKENITCLKAQVAFTPHGF